MIGLLVSSLNLTVFGALHVYILLWLVCYLFFIYPGKEVLERYDVPNEPNRLLCLEGEEEVCMFACRTQLCIVATSVKGTRSPYWYKRIIRGSNTQHVYRLYI